MSWSLVPEGPNVYRTKITQSLKAPERNVFQADILRSSGARAYFSAHAL